MRAITTTVIFLFLTLSVIADGAKGDTAQRCRNEVTNFDTGLSLIQRVEKDLLHGIWTDEAKAGSKQVYQFNNYGLVDIFTTDQFDRVSYSCQQWRVEKAGTQQAYLVLTAAQNGSEQWMRVETTCEGMVLTDESIYSEVFLMHSPKTAAKKMQEAKFLLRGEWYNATYPYHIVGEYNTCDETRKVPGAFLNYSFQKDGSYTKTYGTPSVKKTETGYYEISNDGQYVIFHSTAEGNPEQVVRSTVARISSMTMGELVLEQAVQLSGYSEFFCPENTTIMFIQS
jgi:hypothetical protein